MSSSLSKGFKSKKPQKPVICRVFFNCLRMRRWSGRRLDSWNGMRKRLWFSTFKAALSTPTRFQTLWSLRTKLKSKSSSFGWVLCVLVRGQWPRKHFSLSISQPNSVHPLCSCKWIRRTGSANRGFSAWLCLYWALPQHLFTVDSVLVYKVSFIKMNGLWLPT